MTRRVPVIDKLEALEARFEELNTKLSDPDVVNDQQAYKGIMQEYSHLQSIMEEYQSYKKILEDLGGAKDMMANEADTELKAMAKEEVKELEEAKTASEEKLKILLIPKDPLDGKNTIVEIRAGTGGEEAALFAADLFRMYSRFAEQHGWKSEIMEASESENGGYKEVIFSLSGKEVFGTMRWESGTHRVQRIPATESGGRIHTSAATVAVLPEAEETDVEIKDNELKIDVFRSSGPGGQSVNTTDSAVRITHLPTGLVVTCQDEKSQIKNKAKALKVLRSRLYEQEEAKKQQERAANRKSQVGTGDRSGRIRTYNYPQNRVTDHRINLTVYKLDSIMEGNMSEVIEPLRLENQKELLQDSGI
jgi:peptide chain release factor 1